MIDPITGWFEIAQYEDKRAILIADLVKTRWLLRYPRPIEIMHDKGKEFISNEFRKLLIETEYGIADKSSNSVNPMSNAILERIHHVLGNLVHTFNISTQTYLDKDDLWMGILAAA